MGDKSKKLKPKQEKKKPDQNILNKVTGGNQPASPAPQQKAPKK